MEFFLLEYGKNVHRRVFFRYGDFSCLRSLTAPVLVGMSNN